MSNAAQLDVVTVESDRERAVRPEGLYVAAGPWGPLSSPVPNSGGADQQERGGRLWLMDGGRTLAVAPLLCAEEDAWAGMPAQAAQEVAPWAKVVRILADVPALEEQVEILLRDLATVEGFEEFYEDPVVGAVLARLEATATAEDMEVALATRRNVGRVSVDRLRGQAATARAVALAAADLTAPAPTSWDLPSAGADGPPHP
ncbi:hypothetical protein ACFVXD_37915, partial [Kitasatospora herbaricolor]